MPRPSEPKFDNVPSDSDMTGAFNFYGSEYSWADSKKFIIEYLRVKKLDKKADILKKYPEYEISWVCGWIARLITNGSIVTPNAQKYLDDFINTLKE